MGSEQRKTDSIQHARRSPTKDIKAILPRYDTIGINRYKIPCGRQGRYRCEDAKRRKTIRAVIRKSSQNGKRCKHPINPGSHPERVPCSIQVPAINKIDSGVRARANKVQPALILYKHIDIARKGEWVPQDDIKLHQQVTKASRDRENKALCLLHQK